MQKFIFLFLTFTAVTTLKAQVKNDLDTTKAANNFLKRQMQGGQPQTGAYMLMDKTEMNTLYKQALQKAAASGSKTLVNKTQLIYASRFNEINASSETVNILKGLVTETTFSPAERIHMLCLLIINTIKLNSTENIEKYYNELKQVRIDQYPNSKSEYLLAVAMYNQSHKNYISAQNTYLSLAGRLNRDTANKEIVVEGVLRLAGLYSQQYNKPAADRYFNIAYKAIKLLPKYHPLVIGYTRFHNQHLNRFNKNEQLVKNLNNELLNRDSIYRQELVNSTKELTYKYRIMEGEKNVKIIAQQRELDAVNYSRKKQQSLIIILCLGFVVCLTLSAVYLLFTKRKQASLLHKAEMEHLKQVHRTESIKILAESQEAERRRIAEQLHDEVGSMLTVARLNLSSLNENEEPGEGQISPQQLKTANKILSNVSGIIREMSHQLMPVAIKQYGLRHAVEQLISDINGAGKLFIEQVIIGMDEPGKFAEDFQVSMYRIVQELLQNTVKHSNATNAIFQLIEHKDSINLLIEDNGGGMDVNAKKDGRGLELLKTRIAYYDGTINIESNTGEGLMILIDIPTKHITRKIT